MPRPEELPNPPTISPPRTKPVWAVVALTVLATVGVGAALVGALSLTWFGLGPIGSAATSPRMNAGDSSAIPPASSVTPVTFDQAMTMIAAANPSPVFSGTPEILRVYTINTPTPLPLSGPPAFTATAEARLRAEMTATAKPPDCQTARKGDLCIWATETPVPPPTWTPVAQCETPVPKQECVR